MVGNDIVDLSLASRNAWKQERFLDKVLLSSEKELVKNSSDPGTLLWLLWSMKESAYKLNFRTDLKRSMNPIRFTCSFDTEIELGFDCETGSRVEGRVSVGQKVYRTDSIIRKGYVHTTALPVRQSQMVSVGQISADDPDKVRHNTINELIQAFAITSGLKYETLKFTKDKNGIPLLTDADRSFCKACSISHDGRFGAYAFALRS